MFDLSMFPEAVTRVTPRKKPGLQNKPFRNNAVTPVTRVTPENSNIETDIDPEEWREAFEERAAIMEYSGGLPRHEAERQARVICLAEFRNRKR